MILSIYRIWLRRLKVQKIFRKLSRSISPLWLLKKKLDNFSKWPVEIKPYHKMLFRLLSMVESAPLSIFGKLRMPIKCKKSPWNSQDSKFLWFLVEMLSMDIELSFLYPSHRLPLLILLLFKLEVELQQYNVQLLESNGLSLQWLILLEIPDGEEWHKAMEKILICPQ